MPLFLSPFSSFSSLKREWGIKRVSRSQRHTVRKNWPPRSQISHSLSLSHSPSLFIFRDLSFMAISLFFFLSLLFYLSIHPSSHSHIAFELITLNPALSPCLYWGTSRRAITWCSQCNSHIALLKHPTAFTFQLLSERKSRLWPHVNQAHGDILRRLSKKPEAYPIKLVSSALITAALSALITAALSASFT